VGYLIAPRPIVSDAIKIHQHIVSCPNAFVQYGAQAALEGPQDCVREMVAEFDRRRKLLVSRMEQIGMPCVPPAGAFYAFPSVAPYGMTSKQFADFLLAEARVAVVPGSAFGAVGEGYIRIAYSTAYEEIERGMDRIGEAVRKI